MNVIVVDDYMQLSDTVAKIIAQRVQSKKDLVLGLATGSTPLGMYQELIHMSKNNRVNFGQVTTFNLDEYVGLSACDPQSYCRFMQEHFFDQIKVKRSFIPNGLAPNLAYECLLYESEIKRYGGIDLQILGIGRDGHIGFNEPGSACNSRTCVVQLDDITIRDNARFFNNDRSRVPRQALTMGIETILEARECLLIANGAHKADIVARALRGPVTESVPASLLRNHKSFTVVLDKAAAISLG